MTTNISIPDSIAELVIKRRAIGERWESLFHSDDDSEETSAEVASLEKEMQRIDENCYFALEDAMGINDKDVAEYWRLNGEEAA